MSLRYLGRSLGDEIGDDFRFGAGLVIGEAERGRGSDPLLPASLRSVAQKGQTPCRTVISRGVWGTRSGTIFSSGRGW